MSNDRSRVRTREPESEVGKMFIKIIGKSKAIKDLERAENLIREAHDILWRLPSELQLEVSDGNNEVTDSVQDNQ